jgi:hypothetical protein
MEDGTIVKPENAVEKWGEETDWDGDNHISRATGSQWNHQTLYKTRKGRYWVEHESQWQGSRPHAEWVSEQEAARWLILMDHDLPDDDQVEE